jgi:hypothetical protein
MVETMLRARVRRGQERSEELVATASVWPALCITSRKARIVELMAESASVKDS